MHALTRLSHMPSNCWLHILSGRNKCMMPHKNTRNTIMTWATDIYVEYSTLTPCPLESITLSCLLACTIITLLGVGLGGLCVGLGLLVLIRVWVGLSSFNSIRLVHTLLFFHSQYSRLIIHLGPYAQKLFIFKHCVTLLLRHCLT